MDLINDIKSYHYNFVVSGKQSYTENKNSSPFSKVCKGFTIRTIENSIDTTCNLFSS